MSNFRVCPPITAWVIRSLHWDFQHFQKSVATELAPTSNQDLRCTVKFVDAHRSSTLDKNRGEINVVLNEYTGKGNDAGVRDDLKRRMKEKGGDIIKEGIVLTNGDFVFIFDCESSERTEPSMTKDNFFVYKRDEGQFPLEAMRAAREMFKILGIDESYLRHAKLHEMTLVIDTNNGGAWSEYGNFILRANGLRE